MSDSEEDLTDFQKNLTSFFGRIFGWSISRTIGLSMDSRNWDHDEDPTSFEVSTSWFKYEELIDDWLDLTVLEAGKRGPALENRLVGDSAVYKGETL